MKRARKSNRVSWAPGFNLCQVKLFLSEDCPSKVGQISQDHLEGKASSILHSSTCETYDLPPGFEGNHFLNKSKDDLSRISQIKWKAPPLFVLSHKWLVAAGEESREKENQKLREMRVLEAVYPRPSAIPPSPSVSLDVEEEDYDDNLTPLVPLVPIEEEDLTDTNPELPATTFASVQPQSLHHQYVSATKTPISSQPITPPTHASPGTSGLDADLAAASSVVSAIMKNNEQGSMIDMNLLVRIFNDPLMIGKLINDHNKTAFTTSGLKGSTPSVPLSSPNPDKLTSGVTLAPTSTVGLSPDSGLKLASSSVPLLHTLDKPSTLSLPFSSHAITTTTTDFHRPVNINTHHFSNGGLPSLSTQPPHQDAAMSSGLKRTASVASIGTSEPSTVPLPSTSMNLHAVANQVRTPSSTMAYRPPSTGPAFAGKEAHTVKDLSYYKNLIRQHGADFNEMQETQDSQIGIRQGNYQDLKLVQNTTKPEVNFKIQRPCMYFKSPRGCRNGSNCPYQHDMSTQWGSVNILGSQNAKRVKLGPEIKGRT